MQGSQLKLKKKLKQTWKSFGIHRGYQEPTSPSTPVQRGKENWKENIKSLQIISRGEIKLKRKYQIIVGFSPHLGVSHRRHQRWTRAWKTFLSIVELFAKLTIFSRKLDHLPTKYVVNSDIPIVQAHYHLSLGSIRVFVTNIKAKQKECSCEKKIMRISGI